MDWGAFALGLGLGLGSATLLWWTLFLSSARVLIVRAIRQGSFRYLGQLYLVRRAGEANLTERMQ